MQADVRRYEVWMGTKCLGLWLWACPANKVKPLPPIKSLSREDSRRRSGLIGTVRFSLRWRNDTGIPRRGKASYSTMIVPLFERREDLQGTMSNREDPGQKTLDVRYFAEQ